MPHDEVQRILYWADGKLVTGNATPWDWPNYFKLRETLELIVSGMEVTTREAQMESSPAPEPARWRSGPSLPN